MTPEPHTRDPESLSNELWFYSLERRRQSTDLRRASIAVTVVAIVLVFIVVAGSIAAVAAAVTIEVAAYLRGQRQKAAILAQLREGANPQLVDPVGSTLPNRSVLLLALAVAVVVAALSLLIIGQLT